MFVIILEIALFLIMFVIAIYIALIMIMSKGFYNTPTVTSSKKSTNVMIDYLNKYLKNTNKDEIKIVDFGSGYGRLIFNINKKLNNAVDGKKLNITGYEISSIPYKISNLMNRYDNVKIVNDDINNIQNFDYDVVITFMLARHHKKYIDIYRKLPIGTTIIANSIPILFNETDTFKLVEEIKVEPQWKIFIYKNI